MRADHSLNTRLKDPQTWITLILALTLLGLWTGRLAPDDTCTTNPCAPATAPTQDHTAANDLVQAQWVVAAESR